jgi:phosphatidylglycerol:prolipoprotein diacylglycerol transferase
MLPRLLALPAFDLLGRRLGPLPLHTYGVLMAAAFLLALWVVARQARRDGLDSQRTGDLAIYALIGGLVGARVMLLITEWRYFRDQPAELSSLLTSGGVFYGGFLGALPVAIWYMRRHALPAWRTADVLAPAVALGQAVGRLGCFAAGCCFGLPAQVPWAVTFTSLEAQRNVGTPLDVALHPSQLYESAACLVIFAALLWLARRKGFHGQVVLAYVTLYATARYGIEMFRGDEARGVVQLSMGHSISTSQMVALPLILAALLLYPYLRRTQRVSPQAP